MAGYDDWEKNYNFQFSSDSSDSEYENNALEEDDKDKGITDIVNKFIMDFVYF